MPQTLAQSPRVDLLNTVGRPQPAKAKLSHHSVVSPDDIARASRILRLAITRSGVQQKALGNGKDRGQVTKKLNGTSPDKLWFHEMLAAWPVEVWIELIALLAIEFGGNVERTVRIQERSAKTA